MRMISPVMPVRDGSREYRTYEFPRQVFDSNAFGSLLPVDFVILRDAGEVVGFLLENEPAGVVYFEHEAPSIAFVVKGASGVSGGSGGSGGAKPVEKSVGTLTLDLKIDTSAAHAELDSLVDRIKAVRALSMSVDSLDKRIGAAVASALEAQTKAIEERLRREQAGKSNSG